MSGDGWSPEEVIDESGKLVDDTGKNIEDFNPFGQSGGEINNPNNTQPEGWGPYTPPPYVDPMTLINQKYLKQGSDNSLAPMQAYQQYMQNRR